MPSTLVHMAIGALLGAAMLDEKLDKWAVLALMLAAMLPDVDSFISIFYPGMHRTLLHNLFFPALVFLPIFLDLQRENSFIEREWGEHAAHVMLACFVALTFAGIGLDAVGSGANLVWPVQDQYYHVSGVLVYEMPGGWENTLMDPDSSGRGSTGEMYYGTAVDPERPHGVDIGSQRRFPFFGNGMQLLFSMAAFLVVGYRLRSARAAS